MTKDEVLQQALEALNKLTDVFLDTEGNHGDYEQKALNQGNKTILAIKKALAQPEQDQFKPDWNTEAVLVEEMQRMAKRIEKLEALAQPEQEPVAWMDEDGDVLSASIVDGKGLRNIPLYTSPPQREWVGLTDDEIDSALGVYDSFGGRLDARKIEAKLKEKNT